MEINTIQSSDALIIVDVQNDFLPGGALPVIDGDRVIPIANQLCKLFPLIVATQDWHPSDHCSFANNHRGRKVGDLILQDGLEQMLWPAHCVQGTYGGELAAGLDVRQITRVFQKGIDPLIDSYSGLYDNGHRRSTGLSEFLKKRAVSRAFVLGLATDYCVKSTACDSAAAGFETFVVLDGCRGVEIHPGDVARAISEMQKSGVRMLTSSELSIG